MHYQYSLDQFSFFTCYVLFFFNQFLTTSRSNTIMSHATLPDFNAVEEAAYRAVYALQYNTNKAVLFVQSEVPTTPYDLALDVINRIVRPTPAKRK
jgi:hypothetical protein